MTSQDKISHILAGRESTATLMTLRNHPGPVEMRVRETLRHTPPPGALLTLRLLTEIILRLLLPELIHPLRLRPLLGSHAQSLLTFYKARSL